MKPPTDSYVSNTRIIGMFNTQGTNQSGYGRSKAHSNAPQLLIRRRYLQVEVDFCTSITRAATRIQCESAATGIQPRNQEEALESDNEICGEQWGSPLHHRGWGQILISCCGSIKRLPRLILHRVILSALNLGCVFMGKGKWGAPHTRLWKQPRFSLSIYRYWSAEQQISATFLLSCELPCSWNRWCFPYKDWYVPGVKLQYKLPW